MNPQSYVISVNGKFVGDRVFSHTPMVGDIIAIQGKIVEIVEVWRTIGVILAEV